MARAAVAAFVVVAAGAALPAPAHAAGTAGYCPDGNGVTVVVDFHELGGGVVIRCAPGEQASGHAALQHAGFAPTGTNRWGAAFICRINGKPTAAAEPCIDTPPATAYWSYWQAPDGGSWTYSDKGIMNRKPPLGSFEGWSFAKNRTAGALPRPGADPSRPVPPPPPPPPPTQAGAVRPTQPQPTAATGTTGGAQPEVAATTAAAASAAAPAGTTPSSADSGTAAATAATPPADLAAHRTGGGVPAGTLAGAGLLLALAAAGGVTMWRRRRQATGDGGS